MPIPVNKSIFRVLDTVGDGTGSTSQNVNGSVTAVEYFVQPPAGTSYILKRMNVLVIDANFNVATSYGALAALTNGIKIEVRNINGVVKDFTEQVKIKRSYDYTLLAGGDNTSTGGAGADALRIRWTFARGYDDILLNGDTEDKLVVTIQDDLTGLDEQVMEVQGYERDNKQESNL